ncbi:hypothetical protein K438DRAFT_1926956 [Mycena galopus ATCC 62051]|nr:hypothetical protein K438DRAFT_1926956 [Mycena galopus ATCC 62051]
MLNMDSPAKPPMMTMAHTACPTESPPAKPHLMYGRCTGSFFTGAKHFVVAGGTFTNITHLAPSNFRTIPMGDLDFRHEIHQNTGSRVARRCRDQNSVRRMYSVRVHGSNSAMTAVLYQGAHTEQQCRAEISKYSELRHPYLLQLYGIANTASGKSEITSETIIAQERHDRSHSKPLSI